MSEIHVANSNTGFHLYDSYDVTYVCSVLFTYYTIIVIKCCVSYFIQMQGTTAFRFVKLC